MPAGHKRDGEQTKAGTSYLHVIACLALWLLLLEVAARARDRAPSSHTSDEHIHLLNQVMSRNPIMIEDHER